MAFGWFRPGKIVPPHSDRTNKVVQHIYSNLFKSIFYILDIIIVIIIIVCE